MSCFFRFLEDQGVMWVESPSAWRFSKICILDASQIKFILKILNHVYYQFLEVRGNISIQRRAP